MILQKLRWDIAQWVELRWWKNYLGSKNKLEYLAWKKEYWQGVFDLVKADFEIKIDDKILDAGCGPAGIFMLFPNNKTTALDPLLSSYESDLASFDKADYPNVEFQGIPLEELKSKGLFQHIFCMNAINHVKDIKICLKNLFSSLDSGGKMLLSIDAHNYNFYKSIFSKIPGDVLHPHQYNLEEYKNLVLEEGFQLEKEFTLKKEYFFTHYMLLLSKK